MNLMSRQAGHPPILVTLLIVLLAASGCTRIAVSVLGRPTLMGMARALGTDAVRALIRGYVPGLSTEIVLVPKPWNVLGDWAAGVQRPGVPGTGHSSPWAYHQRVPLTLYGPGYIRSGVKVERSASVADLAPTLAELLDLRFRPRGSVLHEALVETAGRRRPRAIVVIVLDGGGWNVLQHWTDAWPAERRLLLSGTTFTNATIGSAPSATAPIHATIGTGAYPARHGIADNRFRHPDGTVQTHFLDGEGTELLRVPTLADAWDGSKGNRAWVGMLGLDSWHLGMMGTGGFREGADRDVAVLWEQERMSFRTNEDLYTLPPYLPKRAVLEREIKELDAADGAIDGRWRREPLDQPPYAMVLPAFAEYQGHAAVSVLRREPVGDDAVTDLLFVELKSGDVAGHHWNMTSPEFRRIWRTQDRVLGDLLRLVDERVGSGHYVVALTADHGMTPSPETRGGLRIDRSRLLDDLNARFGDVVESVALLGLYLKAGVTERVDAEAIANHIANYRYGDLLPADVDTSTIPESVLRKRVFAAALPADFLASLSPDEVDRLGPGIYPEGDLTTPPRLNFLAR